MKIESLLPLGKLDPGLREPDTPLDIREFGKLARVAEEVGLDAVLVEERAIGTDLGGRFVLLVGEDNVVEQRYVTLGPIQDDGTVVVEEGLDGSETYVVNGMLRARAGFPVTPQTVAEAAAAQSSRPTVGPAPEGDSAVSGDGS